MAIRRTRSQKEHARLRQEAGLTYQYKPSTQTPDASTNSLKSAPKAALTDRKLKQLLMNDPHYIVTDLRKTMVVTSVVVTILGIITFFNFR